LHSRIEADCLGRASSSLDLDTRIEAKKHVCTRNNLLEEIELEGMNGEQGEVVGKILKSGNIANPNGGKNILISCSFCRFVFSLTVSKTDKTCWKVSTSDRVHFHKQNCVGGG
jgi:hypothetical protein